MNSGSAQSTPSTSPGRIVWSDRARVPRAEAAPRGGTLLFADAHERPPLTEAYACDSEDDAFLVGQLGPQAARGSPRSRKRARPPVDDCARARLEAAIGQLEAVAAAAAAAREAAGAKASADLAEAAALSQAASGLREATSLLRGTRRTSLPAAARGPMADARSHLTALADAVRTAADAARQRPSPLPAPEPAPAASADPTVETGLAAAAACVAPISLDALQRALGRDWGREGLDPSAAAAHWGSKRLGAADRRRDDSGAATEAFAKSARDGAGEALPASPLRRRPRRPVSSALETSSASDRPASGSLAAPASTPAADSDAAGAPPGADCGEAGAGGRAAAGTAAALARARLVRDTATLQSAAASLGPATKRLCQRAGVALHGEAGEASGGGEGELRAAAASASSAELAATLAALRSLRSACERSRVALDVARRREKLQRAAALAAAEAAAATAAADALSEATVGAAAGAAAEGTDPRRRKSGGSSAAVGDGERGRRAASVVRSALLAVGVLAVSEAALLSGAAACSGRGDADGGAACNGAGGAGASVPPRRGRAAARDGGRRRDRSRGRARAGAGRDAAPAAGRRRRRRR